MDAVEFFKTVNRYCKNQGCKKYLACRGDLCMIWPDDDSTKSIEEMVSKVEQWAKDNPIKTRQSEFLKIFPNVQIQDNVIWVCPKCISCNYRQKENCYETNCLDCKREFWLTEVTDND